MASTPLNKLAYQTLQQGKNLAGLAHKELSTKLMGWLSPDAVPNTVPVPSDMLGELRLDMSELQDLDYAEAISRLNIQMLALQAAQQTFAKTQQMSLFNYL